MKKRVILTVLTLIIFFSLSIITADPGMFTPDTIKDLNLEDRGLKISTTKIFNPPEAGLHEAVLYTGATSEFVSADGLILTNHHVAFGAVQRISSKEHDYIKEGFLAKTREEEVPASRYAVGVLRLYEDITDKVLDGVKDEMNEEERNGIIKKNSDEIIKEAEEEHPNLSVSVRSFYDGNRYYLIGYFIIKDIRIVYVPPRAIGEYGGDIDNWMWPRHTGDFSFLRAYVGKNGESAEYSKDNVPYKPRTWLEVEPKGVKEGDFVFTIGYPARTYRYKTSYFIDYQINTYYPYQIEYRTHTISELEEAGEKDKELEIRFASRIKGLNNYLKNFQGKRRWSKRINLIEIKRELEDEFQKFTDDKPDLKEKYGNVLDKIKEMFEERKSKSPLIFAKNWLGHSVYIDNAMMIYNYSIEKEKPDEERSDIFKEENINKLSSRLKRNVSNVFLPLEKSNFKKAIIKAAELPENLKIEVIESLLRETEGNTIEEKAENLTERAFADIKSPNSDIINQFFDKRRDVLLESEDIFMKIAIGITDLFEEIDGYNEEFYTKMEVLERIYTEGMIKFKKSKGEVIFPDANSTLRFTYGNVKGYVPRDAMYYEPFTTFSGVMEKHTGESPFDVPERLQKIYKNKDYDRWIAPELNDVPVCFITTTDITGGNSGSPVLNGEGKLVGCVFDLNWEGITNDYKNLPDLVRCISVDIRYILMITEKFGAGYLLEEMGVE